MLKRGVIGWRYPVGSQKPSGVVFDRQLHPEVGALSPREQLLLVGRALASVIRYVPGQGWEFIPKKKIAVH